MVVMCLGWGYSISIAVLYSIIAPASDHTCDVCYLSDNLVDKVFKTIFAVSVIWLVILVVVLQMATYFKLWKRQRMAIRSVISNNGR